MTAPNPPRSEAERHAQAKAAIPRVEQRIDNLLERRRQILRESDANSLVAVRVDREISSARALRLRLIEQVPLLERLVGQQQQARKEMPTSREQARARRLALQPRMAQFAAIRWDALNAGQQAEYDTLRQQDYYFAGLEKTLPSEAALAKESAT